VIFLLFIQSAIAGTPLTIQCMNCKDDKSFLVKHVEDVANEIMKSKCFATFWGTRTVIETNGRSRDGVLKHITSTPNEIEVTYYFEKSDVVGYTEDGTNHVFANEYWHDRFDDCQRASNFAHEASHVIGYWHDFERTGRRQFSVPYTINAGFTACCHSVSPIKMENLEQ